MENICSKILSFIIGLGVGLFVWYFLDKENAFAKLIVEEGLKKAIKALISIITFGVMGFLAFCFFQICGCKEKKESKLEQHELETIQETIQETTN
jgi:hypothetical protein